MIDRGRLPFCLTQTAEKQVSSFNAKSIAALALAVMFC